jgi:hypothetical protein
MEESTGREPAYLMALSAYCGPGAITFLNFDASAVVALHEIIESTVQLLQTILFGQKLSSKFVPEHSKCLFMGRRNCGHLVLSLEPNMYNDSDRQKVQSCAPSSMNFHWTDSAPIPALGNQPISVDFPAQTPFSSLLNKDSDQTRGFVLNSHR